MNTTNILNPKRQRPNVLLLYTDQQRWDTIRYGGNTQIQTPHLDQLAESGAYFDHAFVNCPVCMPSRMSMLSGQYPSSVGVCTNGIEMPEGVPCVQDVLGLYGYQTANIGKLHFKNHASPYRNHREPYPSYGFDTLILSDEPGCYDDAYIKWVENRNPSQVDKCRIDTPPAWTGKPISVHPRDVIAPYVFDGDEDLTHTAFVADQTIEFLRQRQNEPFFCISGFYAPHAPLNPPRRFVEMYDPDQMTLPHRNQGENYKDTSEQQWRKVKTYYYALISHIDDQIGQIMSALGQFGLREKTLVIFTSDHGENLGDHGLVGKGQPYDSSARVPLIVSHPTGFGGGQHYSEIIEAVDIVPSILDWCGIQIPPYMQGRSFRSLIEGRPYSARESAFIELRNPFAHSYKAIRSHDYLYSQNNRGQEQLFDLTVDPHQLYNITDTTELDPQRGLMLRKWFEVEKQYPLRTANY